MTFNKAAIVVILLLGACFASVCLADVQFWRLAWPNTDFSQTSVEFDDILDGGPGKDGIPSVDMPEFHGVADETDLQDAEPVITVIINGEIRGYPLRYLIWHEIVNDVIGGMPVAVTYCPLCNSAVVFDRRLDGRVLELGVSGLLRNSDMIMYDRQTDSWWQQFTGEAIVGELLGARLRKIPSFMENWGRFRGRGGVVMTRPGDARAYGANPYVSYDTGKPFLYFGEDPPFGINPLERVIVVGNKAWTLARLRRAGQIRAGGLVLDWTAGTASALDSAQIAKGRDVGAVRVRDVATGADVVHDVVFAFVFHSFHPDGEWMVE